MNAFLTAVVLWLSANFDLPAATEHPRVELVPAAAIASLRYKGLAGWQMQAPHTGQAGQREVVSVYDDRTKSIYLREDWTGGTPAELSVLVHEMVHHLQNVGKLKFECPQQREEAAYKAQDKWLKLFGRDLETEFELDGFTLLVSTQCIP